MEDKCFSYTTAPPSREEIRDISPKEIDTLACPMDINSHLIDIETAPEPRLSLVLTEFDHPNFDPTNHLAQVLGDMP